MSNLTSESELSCGFASGQVWRLEIHQPPFYYLCNFGVSFHMRAISLQRTLLQFDPADQVQCVRWCHSGLGLAGLGIALCLHEMTFPSYVRESTPGLVFRSLSTRPLPLLSANATRRVPATRLATTGTCRIKSGLSFGLRQKLRKFAKLQADLCMAHEELRKFVSRLHYGTIIRSIQNSSILQLSVWSRIESLITLSVAALHGGILESRCDCGCARYIAAIWSHTAKAGHSAARDVILTFVSRLL